jgi:hypothetical protein
MSGESVVQSCRGQFALVREHWLSAVRVHFGRVRFDSFMCIVVCCPLTKECKWCHLNFFKEHTTKVLILFFNELRIQICKRRIISVVFRH